MEPFEDTDFGGGKWIGGEYFASAWGTWGKGHEAHTTAEKRERRKQGKEEAIYGVFGEGAFRAATTQVSAARYMLFTPPSPVSVPTPVSPHSILNPAPSFVSSNQKLGSEDVSSTPAFFVVPGKKTAEKPAATAPSAPAPKKHEDFGAFLDSSVGSKVLGMMKSMGWDPSRPAMGKNKTGRVNPIMVQPRTERAGLGAHGDEVLPETLDPEAKRRRREQDDEMERIASRKRKQEQWKKGGGAKKRARKMRYQDMVDLTQESAMETDEEEAGGDVIEVERPAWLSGDMIPEPVPLDKRKRKEKIVVMRGSETTEYGDLSEVPLSAAPDRSGLVPELRFNTKLLADLSKEDVVDLRKKASGDRDRVEVLRYQVKIAQTQANTLTEARHRLKQISDILTKLHERIKASLDDGEGEAMRVATLIDIFDTLRYKFSAEYHQHHLPACALALIAPLLDREFANWRPLEQPLFGVDLIESLQAILNDPSIPGFQESTSPYATLIWEKILPRLRNAIMVDWSVTCDADKVVSMVTHWLAIMPHNSRQHLLDAIIVPRLLQAVEKWDPAGEVQAEVPIQEWFIPWVKVLEDRLETAGIFHTVRYKLAMFIKVWDPLESVVGVALVQPWKVIFSSKAFDALSAQAILPRLRSLLHDRFEINPAQQDILPFQAVLQWVGVLPDAHVLALLETEFFPAWFRILHQWLNATPDFSEVAQWYQGWKTLFPSTLLAYPGVERAFTQALVMMNQALEGQAVVLQPTPSLLAAPQESKARSKPKEEKRPRVREERVTLKDVVERMAAEAGVEFFPRAGQRHEGKPLYQLGTATVYLEHDCVYAKTKGDKTYRAVTLEEVLEVCK